MADCWQTAIAVRMFDGAKISASVFTDQNFAPFCAPLSVGGNKRFDATDYLPAQYPNRPAELKIFKLPAAPPHTKKAPETTSNRLGA